MVYAPFIVPTLCRSEHFIRMIESLKRNSWACHTDVIVSVDFPPSDKYRNGWQEICDFLDQGDFSVFNRMIVFKQTDNLGPGKNGTFLKQYVSKHYDRWIYCDDDCEFSPNFLEYMDKCLDFFKDDPDVVAVSGYSYPIDWMTSNDATCMKQQFNVATWGIGRWVDKNVAVEEYIRSGNMIDDAQMVIKSGRYKKMLSKCFVQYINRASTDRIKVGGDLLTRNTDLAMRVFLACKDKYCVSPIISKSRNYGFDGSGVYCQNTVGLNRENPIAIEYDYSLQTIDTANHFDIVLNDPSLNEANRQKLDAFDAVPTKKKIIARLRFLIIKFFGVPFARKVDSFVPFVLYTLHLKKKPLKP